MHTGGQLRARSRGSSWGGRENSLGIWRAGSPENLGAFGLTALGFGPEFAVQSGICPPPVPVGRAHSASRNLAPPRNSAGCTHPRPAPSSLSPTPALRAAEAGHRFSGDPARLRGRFPPHPLRRPLMSAPSGVLTASTHTISFEKLGPIGPPRRIASRGDCKRPAFRSGGGRQIFRSGRLFVSASRGGADNRYPPAEHPARTRRCKR